MAKAAKQPADYILPLYMSGLSGRLLRLKPLKPKQPEILFIYGHNASLESCFGVADYLNHYGGLTMPDLPGFGGMDAFYKIAEKPSLDNFAAYLASFIKWRYKKRQFVVVGSGLGVVIVTRMLQKYPELTKQVQMMISIAGFSHHTDFKFSSKRRLAYRLGSKIGSFYGTALFYKLIILRPMNIRYVYRHRFEAKQKTGSKNNQRLEQMIENEIKLWRCSEPRTYMSTVHMMLGLDLTKFGHVNLPIHHCSVIRDPYFNEIKVEQHLRQIYNGFIVAKIKAPKHGLTMVSTAKDAKAFIPKKFINALKRLEAAK